MRLFYRRYFALLAGLGRALAAPDPAAVYAWFGGDASDPACLEYQK